MRRRPRGFIRRRFLRGGGGALLALPLPEAFGLRPERAYGQPGAAPRRLVFFIHPYGIYQPHFWPLAPGTAPVGFDFKLKDGVFRTGDTEQVTASFDLPPSLQPLADHRKDLLVLEGLNNPVDGHPGYTPMMTGTKSIGVDFASSPSVDQMAAGKLGAGTRLPSLQAGVRCGDAWGILATCSWYDACKPAQPQQNPVQLFQQVFSDFKTDPMALARLQAERRSVLDAAMAQAAELRPRLGRYDRDKTDQYLQSLREVERRLDTASTGGGGGSGCARPTAPTADTTKAVPDAVKAHLDIMAMALACDLTRVAMFQISEGSTAGGPGLPWLDVNLGWHGLTHDYHNKPDNSALMARITTWHVEMYAYLIGRMKQLGAFANSTVVYMNTQSNSNYHVGNNQPLLLVGSLGGALKQGLHVRYAKDTRKTNDLHLTLLQVLGMDIKVFGDPTWCKGSLGLVLA